VFILSLSEQKVSTFSLFIPPVRLNRPKDIKLFPTIIYGLRRFNHHAADASKDVKENRD